MWLGTNGVLASSLGYDPSTPLVISSHDNTPAIFSTTNLDPTTGLPIPTNGQSQWQAIQANLPAPGVHILPFISGNWFYENFVLAMRVIPYVAGAPLTVSNNYVVGDTNYGVTNQYLGLNFMGASTLTVPTGITLILTNGIGSSATNVVVNNSSTFQINGTANVANLFVATDSSLNVGAGGVFNTSLLTLSNTSPVLISGIINADTSVTANGTPITIIGTGVLNTPSLVFTGGAGTLSFNQTNTLTFAGLISGNGSVIQLGTGTTILTGTNSYTGGTTIRNGTLQISSNGVINHPGASTIIGDQSGDNGSLVINGGLLDDTNGLLGNSAGATGTMTVSGTNSIWTNSGELTIGVDGSGNSMTITNGGIVSVVDSSDNIGTVIGLNSDSSNNSILVTGSNSLLTNAHDMIIGVPRYFEWVSNGLKGGRSS